MACSVSIAWGTMASLARLHRPDGHGILELHGERGLDGLQEARRAAVLARLDVVEEGVLPPRVGPGHGAAAGLVGDGVVVERLRLKITTPDDPGPPRNLCGEKSTASSALSRVAGRVHVDVDVRRGGGEVDERDAAGAVHQACHLVHRREDAGDVGAGAEGADLHRPLAVFVQLFLERREAHHAPRVGRHHHDVGDGLVPRRVVGVVLEVRDEDHRPFVRRDVDVASQSLGGLEAEDALQLVDGPGHAGAAGEHQVVGAGVHVALEDVVRLVVGERSSTSR